MRNEWFGEVQSEVNHVGVAEILITASLPSSHLGVSQLLRVTTELLLMHRSRGREDVGSRELESRIRWLTHRCRSSSNW